MTGPAITIVIPYHQARVRNGMFARAVRSARRQSLPAERILAKLDLDGLGSAVTRNAALEQVETEWVAFLDSDDTLYPDHLAECWRYADQADLVYPWFDHPGRPDPFPGRFNARFAEPLLRLQNYIPITVLARTELVREVGGFQSAMREPNGSFNDEYGLWLRMLDAGARFAHAPARTWRWNIHGGNTLGNPCRGDAV